MAWGWVQYSTAEKPVLGRGGCAGGGEEAWGGSSVGTGWGLPSSKQLERAGLLGFLSLQCLGFQVSGPAGCWQWMGSERAAADIQA